jgi:hypothetical protein
VQFSDTAEATNVQVTAGPLDGVAVTVTLAPTVSPAKVKVGVASAVVLSVFEDPVSDAAVRSGAGVGVLGVTVTVPEEAKDKLPMASTAYALYVPGISPVVGRLVLVFAVAIDTLFQRESADAVIVAVSLGVMLVLTRYIVPVLLD